MPTQVKVAGRFQRDMKHLKKKYPAVSKEVRGLLDQLEEDERPGDKVPGVGHDVYKVRLANPSAQRGKSGGFRAIYYVQLSDTVLMVTIYSKTEQVDVTPQEIRTILEEVLKELEEDDE